MTSAFDPDFACIIACCTNATSVIFTRGLSYFYTTTTPSTQSTVSNAILFPTAFTAYPPSPPKDVGQEWTHAPSAVPLATSGTSAMLAHGNRKPT